MNRKRKHTALSNHKGRENAKVIVITEAAQVYKQNSKHIVWLSRPNNKQISGI